MLCAIQKLRSFHACTIHLPIDHVEGEYMKKLVGILVACSIAGCVGVPYAAKGTAGFAGGYSDEQLGENKYLVRFQGNAYNEMPQVVEYVKRRAAELCAPHDYDIEIKEYISTHTEVGYAGGMAYPSTHQFPNAEGIVICKQ